MSSCSPQRYVAGNRNAVLEATLTPSSVLAVEDNVLPVPTARQGTAQVALSGPYSGAEEATYDIEILDASVEDAIPSKPVFTGEGTGDLVDIAATGVAQDISVELSESGLPLRYAEVDFEGVTIKARQGGAIGNAIYLDVDQTPLVYTPQAYSLLNDLDVGAGGKDAPLEGTEYDFDSAVLGADNAIPTSAHRISFGDDHAHVYLQYKTYLDGKYEYFFVPELKRPVAKGTVVNFVTGGRTVRVYPGTPPETYTGIVTLYDLLVALQTNSQLVIVDGIVANDRSPTGQASQELQTRTDAYAEAPPGEGSDDVATAHFEDVTVDPAAGTQLVIATCRAVGPADHPLAGVGRERWDLRSSILGALGTLVTGDLFSGSQFSLRIPPRLPFAQETQVGKFTVTDIVYVTRGEEENDPPPICPEKGAQAGLLGPNSVDQVLTLVYTARPSGDCNCVGMTTENLDTSCLGNEAITEGADSMTYQTDTIERIKDLREWYTGIVRENSGLGGASNLYSQVDPFINGPVGDNADRGQLLSLRIVVDRFEETLALIDPLPTGALRTDGCDAWDTAFAELQTDVEAWDDVELQSFPSERYVARLGQVLITAGISPLGGDNGSTIVSGDGCYRDWGDAFYWAITGSEAGAYPPAFTNHPYWSVRRASEDGAYYASHEFAFQINVRPECIADLREGDTLTYSINGAARPSTYQVGDEIPLRIVGAHDLYLAGGQDESLEQSWLVNGSVSGPFPSYPFDPNAPAPYSTGSPTDLEFLLVEGGIPFAKGDKFTFSIEGGHYRWRKNGGAWVESTPPEPIPGTLTAFDSGLSVLFTPGAAPSFVAGDVFSFRALQPFAVGNVREPTPEMWKWSGSSPTLLIDLGAVVDLDLAAIAFHTLPEGATITLEGSVAPPGAYDWTEPITWRAGPIAQPFTTTRSARYLRLSLTGANDGGIGWFPVLEALSTSKAADALPSRSYLVRRGNAGNYGGGRFLGMSISGDVEWSSLTEADMTALSALADWIKRHDDEPFLFLPQITRPEDAFVVRLLDDEFRMPDLHGWQPNADVPRVHSAAMRLQGVPQ